MVKGSTRGIDGKTYFGQFRASGWVPICRVILIGTDYDEETGEMTLRYAPVEDDSPPAPQA